MDPCFHKGYNETKHYTVVYDSPCVSDRKPQIVSETFIHLGGGNFTQCQEVIKSVFNFTSCTYSRCSFNGIFQPPLQGQFGVRWQKKSLSPSRHSYCLSIHSSSWMHKVLLGETLTNFGVRNWQNIYLRRVGTFNTLYLLIRCCLEFKNMIICNTVIVRIYVLPFYAF